MKLKILLVFVVAGFLISSFKTRAQPVLTSQGNSSKPGYFLIQESYSTGTNNLGASGRNVVWDYSNVINDSGCAYNDSGIVVLCASHVDTVIFEPPGNTNLLSLFPNAGLIELNEYSFLDESTHSYDAFKNTNTGYIDYGGVDSNFVTVSNVYVDTFHFTPPAITNLFPFTYGSFFTNSYFSTEGGTNYAEIDSLWGNAYGTLKLPNKTYTNVLRVLTKSISSDVSWRSDFQYDYWAPDYSYPVLSVEFDSTGSIEFFGYLKNPNSTLPLNLLSFTGTMQHNNAVLNWQTTDEINTQSFTIERSPDAANFTPLGKVAAINTPGVHNYSFTDTKTPDGASYYRLKMYDKDGAFTYSRMVLLNNGAIQFALRVYPNPAQASATVSFTTPLQGKYGITVTGADGKTIKRINGVSVTGANGVQLDTNGMAAGVYIVTYTDANGQHSVKLVKK